MRIKTWEGMKQITFWVTMWIFYDDGPFVIITRYVYFIRCLFPAHDDDDYDLRRFRLFRGNGNDDKHFKCPKRLYVCKRSIKAIRMLISLHTLENLMLALFKNLLWILSIPSIFCCFNQCSETLLIKHIELRENICMHLRAFENLNCFISLFPLK